MISNPHKYYMDIISLQDVHCLLGMMIIFVAFKANDETITSLHSNDPNLSRTIIKYSMPRDRPKVILRFLTLDDASTRVERTLHNKLAPIRCL